MSKLNSSILDLLIDSADFDESVVFEDSSGADYQTSMGHEEVNRTLFFANPKKPDEDTTRGNLRVIIGETPDQTYVSLNCDGRDVCNNEIELEQLLNKEIFGDDYEQRAARN